ncbi:MAG: hypothetical protein IJV23_07945 [Prevotella sp.]|nr:hypothetical protein [Prevotella sp.]
MYTKLTRLSCVLLLFLLFNVAGRARGIDPTKLPQVSTYSNPKYYVIRLSYPIEGKNYYVRAFSGGVDNRITLYPYDDSKYGFGNTKGNSNDNYL